MSYSVIATPRFKKEAKKLLKRYGSLKSELFELEKNLSENPTLGTDLGNNTFKIRIPIKSKGKGKSGGGRVITYIINELSEVILLTIFDKSDFETIDDRVLKNLIRNIRKGKK